MFLCNFVLQTKSYCYANVAKNIKIRKYFSKELVAVDNYMAFKCLCYENKRVSLQKTMCLWQPC